MTTEPREWATTTLVSDVTTASMRAAILSRRSGSVAIVVTRSMVRSSTASFAAAPSASIASLPVPSMPDSISATPARVCSNAARVSASTGRRNRSP